MGPMDADTHPAAPAKPRRQRARWFRRALIVVLAVCALAAALVHQVIAPARIRHGVRQKLQGRWQGPITVGRAAFSLRGPLVVRDVVLADADGRTWATIGHMTLQLADWPSREIRLREIHLDDVHLELHAGHSPPVDLRRQPDASMPALQGVHTRGLDVTIHSTDGAERRLTGAHLDLRRQPEADEVRGWDVVGQGVCDGVATSLTGVLSQHRDEDGGGRMIGFVGSLDRPDAVTSFEIAVGPDAPGTMVFNATIQPTDAATWESLNVVGGTDALQSPEVVFNGQARLTGPDLDTRANLAAHVIRDGPQAGQVLAIAHLAGETYGGVTRGWLRGRLLPGGAPELWGNLVAENVSLRRAAVAAGRAKPDHGRLAAGQFVFYTDGRDLEQLRGMGMAYVDDVALGEATLFRDLADAINNRRGILAGDADAVTVFSLAERVATIHLGRTVDVAAALDVQPGGTVDLATKELDLSVSVAVMSELRPILQMFPMAGLAAGLADSLVQLDVAGTWDTPVITPAANRIVTASLHRFLLAAIDMGGDISGLLMAPTREVLQRLLRTGPAAEGPDWPDAPAHPPLPAAP